MNTLKRIAAGLLFAGTIALALNAASGDAYAKTKAGGSNTMLLGTGGTIPFATPTEPFVILGITWE